MPRKDRTPAPKGAEIKKRYATCKTCGRRFVVPEGWSVGAAARRHYWGKHRDTMTGGRSS